ncbi:MAG TPA: glycosyl hydrolase family 28-related protein, partial [Longimicrobium sp.]
MSITVFPRQAPDNGAQVLNVMAFGARANGTDDGPAIQSAIDAAGPGRVVYFPKGKYRVNNTLQINTRGVTLRGESSLRNANGGTELMYMGNGACVQIGTDDNLPWDRGGYDGVQDTWIEQLWFSHGNPDTVLDLAINGVQKYAAGALGVRDWRGGYVRIRDCGFERFEYSFFGVQSDLNHFEVVQSHYSRYGIYLGPRSDQAVLDQVMGFFAERLITLDGVSQCRITNVNVVDCGNATICPIEIRKGCANIDILYPWFEHLPGAAGYGGTDQLAFVGIGIVDGYAGSEGMNHTAVSGVDVHAPFVYTTANGAAYHTRYLIALDQANRVKLYNPNTTAAAGTALNVDAMIATTSSATGTATAAIYGVRAEYPDSRLFANNSSTATPNWSGFLDGPEGPQVISSQGARLVGRGHGASAGAD